MTTLNSADAIYLGSNAAKRVYAGDVEVWGKHFDPSNLPGLAIWLDAADYTPGTWPNKGTAASQPTFVGTPLPIVSPVALNGHPVVRFALNEGRLRGTNSGVTYAHTLLYVVRTWGTNVGRALTAQYPPSNFLVGYHSSAYDCMYDNGWLKNDVAWPARPTPWRMYGSDGDLPTYMPRFFINGALAGTGPSGGGMAGTYHLSGYDAALTQETMDCEVAELLIYNRKLADADRQAVEQYLTSKYSL